MKQTAKRFFALLLALSMCLSLAAPAWAAETDPADEIAAESSAAAEPAADANAVTPPRWKILPMKPL